MSIQETVVIFGATGGIGSSLASMLTQEGKKTILCSRNPEKLHLLSESLSQPSYVCNPCFEEETRLTFETIVQEHGQVHGVVNCTGSFFIKPMHLSSLEEWNQVIQVNLTSCFCILKYALEHALIPHEGAAVLVSSCAAQMGLAHHEVISAAKAGVEGLIRAAAASYAHKKIRINGIAPGLTDTPLSTPLTSNPASLKASLSFHPLGRIGTKEDIASAISWLLSKQSSWITGEVLPVDGGLTHIKLRAIS